MKFNKKINIPIYLISLDKDGARRDKLKERFSETYYIFQHIEAIDGRILPAKEYFFKTLPYFQNKKMIMSPTELGCALSHIKALEAFLASGKKFGLILEDDIIGTDEDIYKINDLVKNLKENEMLLCGGLEGLNHRYYFTKNHKDNDNIEIFSKFSYRYLYRACCYVVSQNSAQKILNFHKMKFINIADIWGDFFSEQSVDICYSAILKHPIDLSDSNIESYRVLHKKSFLQKLFTKDVFFKFLRRIYWEIRAYTLILVGYKRLK